MTDEELISEGMYYSDRCQFCHEFGEKIEPYLCPDCKARILELGYRKVSGEPPLVKIEQSMVYGDARDDAFNAGAKAQRDADARYYLGV